jgi:hypothetical protein
VARQRWVSCEVARQRWVSCEVARQRWVSCEVARQRWASRKVARQRWVSLAVAVGLHRERRVSPAATAGAHGQHFASGGTKYQGPMRRSIFLTSLLGEGSCSAEPDTLCPPSLGAPSV